MAKLRSIRLQLAHAHTGNLYVTTCDVKNAFLNGFLDENIFMSQLESFVGHQCPQFVGKLNCTLYGLKQVTCRVYKVFSETLRRCRLMPLRTDSAVLFWKINECGIFGVAYVDDLSMYASFQTMRWPDLFTISRDKDTAKIVKNELRKAFMLKDFGPTFRVFRVSRGFLNRWRGD